MHASVSTGTTTRSQPLLLQFLSWYILHRPSAILRTWGRYASAFGESFSFIFLLKTFLAPYKNIKDEYPRRGFNLENILQTLTLNITARVIGMIFRTVAIVIGIAVQALLAACFIAYFLLWIFFPFASAAGLLYSFRS